MKIDLEGEEILLLPEKAFFWPKEKLLGLSDVHLGKLESYQKMGIPVPSGEHQADLHIISKLIDQLKPDQVLILGDWIHHEDSWTDELVKDLQTFFNKHQEQKWFLILGNHERGSTAHLELFPITLVKDHIDIPPFRFAHGHLSNKEPLYRIEGHIHPIIVLQSGLLKMRLPCFVKKKKTFIIPSFGTLTGGFEIKVSSSDKVFAVTPNDVFEVNL